MKQKTWIISALMCAMVIMVCLGVLHLLKEMTENNAPSGLWLRKAQTIQNRKSILQRKRKRKRT